MYYPREVELLFRSTVFEIEAKYGSVDAYIERRLGVSPEMKVRMKANLLEKV